jgi:autotransporter-associated beta strand protein
MGGAIFVMDGGSLVVRGGLTIAGNAVAAGIHTAGSAGDGSALGNGLFLNGRGYVRFSPGAGQTEHVFNATDDEKGVEGFLGYKLPAGFTPGDYGLIKSGMGTLVLSAANFYSGGTILKGGTLDITGFAGWGHITFAGTAKLEIANSAFLSFIGFPEVIDFFGKHDVLDLTGLKFHRGAHASYQNDVLTVHSGSVTDNLVLNSPLGSHFVAAKDGHGGTKITLDPPPASAHAVSSPAGHDLSGEWAGGLSASSHHMSDFLLAA